MRVAGGRGYHGGVVAKANLLPQRPDDLGVCEVVGYTTTAKVDFVNFNTELCFLCAFADALSDITTSMLAAVSIQNANA